MNESLEIKTEKGLGVACSSIHSVEISRSLSSLVKRKQAKEGGASG